MSSGKTVKTPGFRFGQSSSKSVKSGSGKKSGSGPSGGKQKRASSKNKKSKVSVFAGSNESASQKYGSQSAYSGLNQNFTT